MNDSLIKFVGENVYIVCGKAVMFHEGVFDLEKEFDRDRLVDIAAHLYQDKFDPASYGPLTVCVICPEFECGHSRGNGLSQMCMSDLPDAVKAALREEFPEYANDI